MNQIQGAIYIPKEPQQMKLQKHDFIVAGERKTSGYQFNLEVKNGKGVNNISGIAVARDLLEILKSDAKCKEIIAEKNFKINLGSDFILHIQCI